MSSKADRKSPFVVLSESLHKIDVIFNSKREDIVKRLREGSTAWEERKRKYQRGIPSEEASSESPDSNTQRRQRTVKRLPRDNDFPSTLTIRDLLRNGEGDRRESRVGLCLCRSFRRY